MPSRGEASVKESKVVGDLLLTSSISRGQRGVNGVLMSDFFSFTVQRQGHTTTEVLKLLLESLTTPAKALLTVCSWAAFYFIYLFFSLLLRPSEPLSSAGYHVLVDVPPCSFCSSGTLKPLSRDARQLWRRSSSVVCLHACQPFLILTLAS